MHVVVERCAFLDVRRAYQPLDIADPWPPAAGQNGASGAKPACVCTQSVVRALDLGSSTRLPLWNTPDKARSRHAAVES